MSNRLLVVPVGLRAFLVEIDSIIELWREVKTRIVSREWYGQTVSGQRYRR